MHMAVSGIIQHVRSIEERKERKGKITPVGVITGASRPRDSPRALRTLRTPLTLSLWQHTSSDSIHSHVFCCRFDGSATV